MKRRPSPEETFAFTRRFSYKHINKSIFMNSSQWCMASSLVCNWIRDSMALACGDCYLSHYHTARKAPHFRQIMWCIYEKKPHIQYSANRKRCKGWIIIIMRYAYALCPCWIDGTFIACEEKSLRKMIQFSERFFAHANYVWGMCLSTVDPLVRSRPSARAEADKLYRFAYSLTWKLLYTSILFIDHKKPNAS